MDYELEGGLADARIALSAAHDHLTRIEERARRVRAEIETTVRAAVQWEMRVRIATAERERDEARAALAAHQRHTDAAVDGVRAMLPAALELARGEEREACAEIAERARRAQDRLRALTPSSAEIHAHGASVAEAIRDEIRAKGGE